MKAVGGELTEWTSLFARPRPQGSLCTCGEQVAGSSQSRAPCASASITPHTRARMSTRCQPCHALRERATPMLTWKPMLCQVVLGAGGRGSKYQKAGCKGLYPSSLSSSPLDDLSLCLGTNACMWGQGAGAQMQLFYSKNRPVHSSTRGPGACPLAFTPTCYICPFPDPVCPRADAIQHETNRSTASSAGSASSAPSAASANN